MMRKADMPDYMQLLDPAALARIHRLEIIARRQMAGFISGRHRSPFKGFSVEFAEHRQYVPGDDIRTLDWRAFGKSDRYYIKQFVEETNLRATILLDASGSMRYAGNSAAGVGGKIISKFRYGQYLAACMTHLLVHQQDAVGLVTFDSAVRKYIPARSRVSHMRVILSELNNTEPGNETTLAPVFHDIAERVHRRGLVVVISDLFDDPDAVLSALHHFRYRKNEVLVFHVMAQEELTFPFTQFTEFHDIEVSDRRLQIDPNGVRANYLDRVRKHIRKLEVGCGQMNADYIQLSTKQPFEDALAYYLAGRRGRGR